MNISRQNTPTAEHNQSTRINKSNDNLSRKENQNKIHEQNKIEKTTKTNKYKNKTRQKIHNRKKQRKQTNTTTTHPPTNKEQRIKDNSPYKEKYSKNSNQFTDEEKIEKEKEKENLCITKRNYCLVANSEHVNYLHRTKRSGKATLCHFLF